MQGFFYTKWPLILVNQNCSKIVLIKQLSVVSLYFLIQVRETTLSIKLVDFDSY